MKVKKFKILVCLFLFAFSALTSFTQENLLKSEYSYRRYTTQDGLPSMAMQNIFKDSKGFLWQGTLKGGARYDGYTFKAYALEIFPFVHRIEEINGKIRFFWNMDILYPETETLIQISDTLKINPYNSYLLPPNFYIYENDSGKKYFVKFESDTISELVDIPQLQGLFRCKAYLDLLQNLLYIPNNREKKISVYHLQTKQVYSIENVVIETFINHSRLGLLAIGNEGIYKIENNQAVLYVPFRFEKQNKIAVETRNGDLYIKDFQNVYRIRDTKVEYMYRGTLQIWDIALDNDENVWLATDKGLYSFFHFDFKNSKIPNHNIRSITQDDNGTYWFSGDKYDIFSMSDGQLKPVEFPDHPTLLTISFNHQFSYKNITYFFLGEGILIHQNNRFHWANLPDSEYYTNITPYGNNMVVTGTNGIFEMTPTGKFVKKLTNVELKQPGYYNDIAVDKNNRLIVGGEWGISIIENEKVTVLKNENTVYSDIICVDYQNHIFSAAKKYLNLVTGDTIITIHTFDNDYIKGLLPFDNDNMLIATIKGFYIFNTKSYFEKNKIELLFYNHNNGMSGIEPYFNGMFLDKQGVIWMPTSESIITFDPQKLIRSISAPNLMIQTFAVSKDNVKWVEVADYTNHKFSYKNKNFKISVIGLNFSAADNVSFHYRLRGFQNEWSEPTKQREITFNNLPPGDYVFEIYADAGTDDSRCEMQSFAFSITPAFWQTWWFLALCILSLMLISAMVAIYYQRRKNNILLQRLTMEKQLNDLRVKSIRLKAIPHFNANVLSAIEYYIMNRSKEEANRLLGIYSNFTYQTLREVDKASRSLQDELDYVQMYLQLEKLRFADKFDYEIDIDPSIDKEVQLPNMVLHTYCENAIKHAFSTFKSGGLLKVTAKQEENMVKVFVEDNGVGRAVAGANTQIRSSKQGLDILNRQIEIYNSFNKQKIVQQIVDLFNDGISCGTRFVMEVPNGFAYQ